MFAAVSCARFGVCSRRVAQGAPVARLAVAARRSITSSPPRSNDGADDAVVGREPLVDIEALPMAHVLSTMNNTMITITDAEGNTLNWASAGSCGFKGSRRGTTYAAQIAGAKAAAVAKEKGVSNVRVLLKGLGRGRVSAVKGIQQAGLNIKALSDVTPVPHNGCRPPKARRL
eukprot:m.57937 g.57937  ORF g.57937 m.57937 type:complete len:173 (+) comp12797_c0_seq3:113-631(+)